jgi:hypothetical protein
MRALILTAVAITLFAAAGSARAQGCGCGCYWGDPLAPLYESWPKEAYFAPIGPQPWFGSMTVAEQARILAARAEAEAKREAAEEL